MTNIDPNRRSFFLDAPSKPAPSDAFGERRQAVQERRSDPVAVSATEGVSEVLANALEHGWAYRVRVDVEVSPGAIVTMVDLGPLAPAKGPLMEPAPAGPNRATRRRRR